jgi:hypothetical protein
MEKVINAMYLLNARRLECSDIIEKVNREVRTVTTTFDGILLRNLLQHVLASLKSHHQAM